MTGTPNSGQTMSGNVAQIACPGLVYIIVDDRAEFDLLALPATDHGEKNGKHVISKTVDGAGVMVVFQHWIKFEMKTPEAVV